MMLPVAVLTLLPASTRADVVLQTQHIQLTLDDQCRARSLTERASGQELLATTARPLMSVAIGGAEVPATALSRQGDRLRVTFGEGRARAELRVKENPSHLSFELLSLDPSEGVFGVVLTSLLVKTLADVASALNATYDDKVAVAVLALSLPVRCQLARYAPSSGTKEGVTQSLTLKEDGAPEGRRFAEYMATSTLATGDGWAFRPRSYTSPLDLSGYGGIGLWVRGDGKGELLKVQLHDGKASEITHFKDHYLKIDFTDWRWVELPRDPKDTIDYSHVTAVNLYYNEIPASATVSCGIDDLRAVKKLTGKPSTAPDDLVLEDFESPASSYLDQEGTALSADCLAQYGMVGARWAVLGCAHSKLSAVIEQVEKTEGLPCPQLSGRWGRESLDVKRSYIMLSDLSEANVDRAIEHAKLADCAMIVICQPAWAKSAGHFGLNESNFPHGLDGMKQVVAKIKAAGLRAGLHFLAAGIDLSDPYVTPVPDPRLLKDMEATLARDIDEKAATAPTTAEPSAFPKEDGGYEGQGTDVQIDQEIIRYSGVAAEGFTGCQRGALGTKPAAHKQGAKISHLRRQYGMLMRDVDSTINDEVAERIATIVNTCGFGMVYFDGSEWLQGEHWYYNAKMQDAYWKRFRNPNDLLIQGSSYSHLSWHMHVRQASADGYRDIKKLLDERSPSFEQGYRKNLMPLDIGWYGIGQDRLRPDDAEYVLCRSIGFDASVGWSTTVADLDRNPRSREMLEMAGRYERLRLAGAFDEKTRAMLREPAKDFRLVREGERWGFVPVEYDEPVVVGAIDGKQNVWNVKNSGKNARQPVEIELTCGPTVRPGANWDRADNMVLEDWKTLAPYAGGTGNEYEKYVIGPGKHGGVKDGVTQRFELNTEVTRTGTPTGRYQATSTLTDKSGWSAIGKRFTPALDLSWMQGIGLWVHGDGNGAAFKVQLRDTQGGWNDHYITLSFTGWRYFELVKPQSGDLDKAHVEYLIFYFNGLPGQETSTVHIDTVKALRELTPPLGDLSLTIGGQALQFPLGAGRFADGDTILFRGMKDCTLCQMGKSPASLTPTGTAPALSLGDNESRLQSAGELTHTVTVRTAKVYQ